MSVLWLAALCAAALGRTFAGPVAGANAVRMVFAAEGEVVAHITNIPFTPRGNHSMCGWDALRAARYTEPVHVNFEHEVIAGHVFVDSVFASGRAFNCTPAACWQFAVNNHTNSSASIDEVWLQPGWEVEWTYTSLETGNG